LAERFPETAETQPEVLAQHYTAAGLHTQALPYWQQAGRRALERLAYREAVGCFEQALSTLPYLPETRDTREQAIDLRLALRSALQFSGDWERLLEYLQEAEALATALNDPRRLTRVASALSFHCFLMGAHDQAITAAQRMLALAPVAGDVMAQGQAHYRLGVAYQAQGDYPRAADCLRQTVTSLDGALRYERNDQGFVSAVMARFWLTGCHAELGRFAEGQALGDEGLQIAEAVAHPGSLMFAAWGRGRLSLHQGDIARALPQLERAMSSGQDADLPGYLPQVATILGAAYTLAGRTDDAVPLLTQAREWTMTMDREGYQALFSLFGLPLAEAQVRLGRLEEAHALVERALVLARAHQERGNEAYALRLLGETAARREPPDAEQAEDYFRQALALADELGMRPLQAHCHQGLGTLYAATGQREQARTALSTAIEMYRAMDMTFWLPETEAALAQVEGR
jgi:tetratricopeptide (TPR) repeat protein